MKKIILLLLSLCCICSVFAQTDSLLKKYRNMALEYNHDLKAAEKNIRASIELEKNARQIIAENRGKCQFSVYR